MKVYSRHAFIPVISLTGIFLFATCCLAANSPAPAAPAKPAPVVAPAKAAGEDAKTALPAASSGPANPNLDPVLKKALDEIGWKYDTSPDGTCRILLSLGKERSHQVFVKSKKDSFVGADFRRIYATSMKSRDLPSADILAKLLQDSTMKKLGAWELHKWSDGYRVILSAKIPADSSSATLKATIRFILFGADEMEDQLTGKDEF